MMRFLIVLSVIALGLLFSEERLADPAVRRVSPEEHALSALWKPISHTDPPPRYFSQRQTASGQSRDCPMLLSLNKASTYELTSVEDGVRFDIEGDGSLELVSWTPPDSDVAFLAFDRDADGRIADGRELIGSYTVSGVRSNGPNALMALAKEGRALAKDPQSSSLHGTINADNPLFSKFVLWFDANHNGISEPGEVQPAEEPLAHIGLGYSRLHLRDRHGNESRYEGYAIIRTAPGVNNAWEPAESMKRLRQMYSVCLVTRKGG
jgi:hypothetical protein